MMFSYIPPEKRLDVTLCQSAKIKAQNEIMNSLTPCIKIVQHFCKGRQCS
jgi:hypothetical protein